MYISAKSINVCLFHSKIFSLHSIVQVFEDMIQEEKSYT